MTMTLFRQLPLAARIALVVGVAALVVVVVVALWRGLYGVAAGAASALGALAFGAKPRPATAEAVNQAEVDDRAAASAVAAATDAAAYAAERKLQLEDLRGMW